MPTTATNPHANMSERSVSMMSAPYENAAIVTPSDTNELDYVTRGFLVQTGGTALKVKMLGGGSVVIPNPMDGQHFPWRIKQVMVTDSDASCVVIALW